MLYGPEPPALAALPAGRVRRLPGAGATLIDARPIASFAAGHIPGALSIELRPAFATWLGWLASPGRDLVFVLDPGQDRAGLVRQARNVGYERLAGELAGGMPAWQAAGLPIGRISLVPSAEVTGTVLDVRQAAEFESGHLPGARHIELGALPDAAAAAGPGGGPVTVMCGHGERAMTAASLLTRAAGTDVAVAVGGPGDWATARARALATGR
jgi:rhodanese-related sulfurtransferase